MKPHEVFETLVSNATGEVRFLEPHVQRLFESARVLSIALPADCTQTAIAEKFKNMGAHKRIKIIARKDTWRVEAVDYTPIDYTAGVTVVDTVFERPYPRAKYSTSVYDAVQAAQPKGVFETLFFDTYDFLLEGNITNVFARFGNVVATPYQNILLGIERGRVIAELQTHGAEVQERDIARSELLQADEIFLTNSVRGIVPVRTWGHWHSKAYEH